jgi:hypothetical protein
VLILEGRGSTSVRDDEGVCTSFEWRAGSLFSVPRARSVRHFNGSGRDRVRFVAITAYPTNASGVPAAAAAGAAGSGDDRVGFELKNALSSDAALVFELQDCVMLDALECPLLAVPHCGVGGHLSSPMGTRGLTITLSQLPPGTYGMAHAYGPGALTIVLAGEGYTLLWPEGARPGRQPWRPGSLVSAAGGWWRQHFNPGRSPARFVTLAPASALLPDVSGMARIWTSTRHGGTRIDYADEAAEIRAGFAVAVQAAGGDVRMPVVCGEREQ